MSQQTAARVGLRKRARPRPWAAARRASRGQVTRRLKRTISVPSRLRPTRRVKRARGGLASWLKCPHAFQRAAARRATRTGVQRRRTWTRSTPSRPPPPSPRPRGVSGRGSRPGRRLPLPWAAARGATRVLAARRRRTRVSRNRRRPRVTIIATRPSRNWRVLARVAASLAAQPSKNSRVLGRRPCLRLLGSCRYR